MKPQREKQSGFVIVIVLAMTLLLSALLMGFNHRCRDMIDAADKFRRNAQALNYAGAGLNIAIAAVRDHNNIYSVNSLKELFTGSENISIQDADCKVKIIDETGKININRLKNNKGKLNRPLINQMLRLIDILNKQVDTGAALSYDIVPAIIDWTDDDDEITVLPFVKYRNKGAESGYYSGLSPPYKCSNSPFNTIYDLLSVKGMDTDTFKKLRDYLTIYGRGRININTAPEIVIRSLSEKIDRPGSEMICDRREIRPFRSISEIKTLPGITDTIYREIKGSITVNPAEKYYRVISTAVVNDTETTVVAVIRKNTEKKKIEVLLYRET